MSPLAYGADMPDADAPFIVYASGGHARVVADAIHSRRGVVLGFVDDDVTKQGTTVMGLPVMSLVSLQELGQKQPVQVALGIGDNAARMAVYERCRGLGLTIGTVIHQAAIVSPSAKISQGTVIFAGAVVNVEANVDAGCIINSSSVVEHNVDVGAFAHVSPGATLAGGSKLGSLSHLGAHAVVNDDIFVGARTVVGSGAVVNRHLPDDVVAYGVPAKVKRQRSEGRMR
jgi:sugar O-acyltransferase (sialic acid O-acetyltransferase NeuD family)